MVHGDLEKDFVDRLGNRIWAYDLSLDSCPPAPVQLFLNPLKSRACKLVVYYLHVLINVALNGVQVLPQVVNLQNAFSLFIISYPSNAGIRTPMQAAQVERSLPHTYLDPL
jgi:hypothetical protein